MGTNTGDRYEELVSALRAQGSVPRVREQRVPWEWHPIARVLLVVALIAILGYGAAQFGIDWVRDRRVDTWSGPDATVQSGQRLEGCDTVNALHHDVFPTWVRFHGVVYRFSDQIRPVIVHDDGTFSLTDSGYQLGQMHLLLDDQTPAGRARDQIVLLLPSAQVGEVFARLPECR